MKTATTYDERMALIKEIHIRKLKLNRVKAKSKNLFDKKPTVVRSFKETNNEKNTHDNINHYTDASKYAKEYYGDRMQQTTRWDNDWGDY